MTDPFVCRGEDDYTAELQTDRGQALWQAELSSGEVVTMDDQRPGVDEPSAWVRLGHYCRRNGLHVRRLWLKFRSNVARDILPADADGYFFCKSVVGMMNSTETYHFYLVGCLRDGELVVQRWQVPELVRIEQERRAVDYDSPCLIARGQG